MGMCNMPIFRVDYMNPNLAAPLRLASDLVMCWTIVTYPESKLSRVGGG